MLFMEVTESLKKQKEVELDHVEMIQRSIERTNHKIVIAILETIIYDSKKHAALYQALIDLEVGIIPTMMNLDMRSALHLHQDIRQHVNIEENMIRNLEKFKENITESRVIDIINYIISDERRHHSLLQRLSNIIDSDVVAYDEYLGLIQKYMVSPPF